MRLPISRYVAALSLMGFAVACWGAVAEVAPDYPYARETAAPTALDRYVAKPDPNYRWALVRTDAEAGLTSYTIDLTSQQWRTKADVTRPIWTHWLTISVPETVAYPTAFLFIDGGSNRPDAEPRGADGDLKRMAVQTQTITASIFMVPNQPLVFSGKTNWGRAEDAMIAYTWDKYFRTGDAEWLARLPMTKSVVRAMDTIQAFCASEAGGRHTVKDFVVAGGSKRGWTTWTTGIVDTRVRAIAPCVIDLLNLIPSFKHHYAVLGFWSAAIGDYNALGILDWLETPENAAMMEIIDPYSYVDRLTMPKLIMHAGNDQFFLPDSARFYWDDLKGPKWMRCMPNVGHGLDRQEAYASLASFHQAIAAELPIPSFDFSFEDNGDIVVRLTPSADGKIAQPAAVKLWQAHNPKTRDFRGGRGTYVASVVEAEGAGVYRASVTPPDSGWIGYFVELSFPGSAPETPFKFTTRVRTVPDTTPSVYTSVADPPKGFLTSQ